MAGERALPGLGLKAFWTLGSNGWNPDLDQDLLMLSVIVQGRSLAFVASLPGSPVNGDIYIMTSGAETNHVAVRDNGAWVYLVPFAGWSFWNVADSTQYRWDGTAWVSVISASVWGTITGTLASQTDLGTALVLLAPKANPTFTGVPAIPTAAPGTNTTQAASTAFVAAAIAAGGGSVPTLVEVSTDSNAIATGSNTFTYTADTHLVWVAGQRLRAINDSTHYMEGVITAVSTTSVTILVDLIVGTGTFTAWTLALAGNAGTNGTNGTNGTSFPAFGFSTKTANYTAVTGDFAGNKLIEMNVASANTFTVNTGLTGTEPLAIAQMGAGQTTIVAGSGVTILSSQGLKLRAVDSMATLVPCGTNRYRLSGDTTA
jgi:hypothetical protein